jgi:Methyl-accepting chemotaxis protein (MCP) signalling domain
MLAVNKRLGPSGWFSILRTRLMRPAAGISGREGQSDPEIAASAVTQADQTDSRINALSQAASRIGDVIKLITSVAEQTNLLALNATIEAARAGEAGRGFAVVAQEVKALAAATAKATDEIGVQIAGMQTATQEAVGSIKMISATIGQISEITSAISAAIEDRVRPPRKYRAIFSAPRPAPPRSPAPSPTSARAPTRPAQRPANCFRRRSSYPTAPPACRPKSTASSPRSPPRRKPRHTRKRGSSTPHRRFGGAQRGSNKNCETTP